METEYICSDCNSSVNKDDPICKNCGADLTKEISYPRFNKTKHRIIFYLLYTPGFLLLTLLLINIYATFEEIIHKTEYYFDPYRTTLPILTSICIAMFVFTFLFISTNNKKRIVISILTTLFVFIIYFLLRGFDNGDSYTLFISMIILEIEIIIFNNFKKFKLLSVLIALPLFLFLGNTLVSNLKVTNQDLSTVQISLEIDVPHFFNHIASYKDEKFDSALIKLESIMEESKTYDPFMELLNIANKYNIELKKYFRTTGDNNKIIIAELKNILENNLKQDSSTFYNRMLLIGSNKITIKINNYSGISILLKIDSTRSSIDKIRIALLDTSRVEFRTIVNSEETINLMQRIEEVLVSENNSEVKLDSVESDQMSPEAFLKNHPLFSIALVSPTLETDSIQNIYIKQHDLDTFNSYVNNPDVKKIIPVNLEFLVSTISSIQLEYNLIFTAFCVTKKAEIYGNMFDDFNYEINAYSIPEYLSFRIKPEAKETISSISESLKRNIFLIKYVNMVYFSPLKIEQVDSNFFYMKGFQQPSEIDYIKTILNSGREILQYKITN